MGYKLELYSSGSDVEAMADLIIECTKDSPFKFEPNREALIKTIKSYAYDTCDYDRFLCVLKDGDKSVGLVGALVLTDHFLLMDHKVGQEIVWWVQEGHRGSRAAVLLIQVLEEWAKRKGLRRLLMGHYEDKHSDKLKRMYSKQGYKLVEYNYIKELV